MRCYAFGENDKNIFALLEYVNKPHYLTDIIDDDMQSIESENELKAYMVDILEGLVYLHDIGVIHADMKLDNILAMTDPDSDLPILKIADLGLA